MMLTKFSLIPRFFFAADSVKSVEGNSTYKQGHKTPVLADNVAGRYAGALFTAASKNEALDVVLADLNNLNKVISE